MNTIKRSWALVRSAWQVLRLDRELVVLPLLSSIVSLLAVIAIIGGGIGLLSLTSTDVFGNNADSSSWPQIVLGAIVYLVLTFVANFFSGAIIYGALQRFNGNDPTVRGSLAAARSKFRPLLLFSLMMASVGFVLQLLEERVPFAGKIAVWLVNAAWSVANIFAVPVIMASQESVSPIAATRASVGIIKKVWGEGFVAQVGVSVVGSLTIIIYSLIWSAIGVGAFAATGQAAIAIIMAVPAILGLIVLMLVFSALGAIVKAALYHYATTGEAPGDFNTEVLRSTMTQKKARRIFA